MPSRRGFLTRAAAAAAVLPIVPIGCVAESESRDEAVTSHIQTPEDWITTARSQIPASNRTAYFQTGGIGPSTKDAIDAVKERLDFQNEGPADPRFSTSMAQIEPDLRAQLARVFGARDSEIALTHSTSEGISIMAWSLDWREGDEVILSNQEHPANVFPWYVLRDRFGIVIREFDFSAGAPLVGGVRSQLSPRTRMVSLNHVSRNNGRRVRTSESQELAALLNERGVRYHLDGAQGPGCVPVDFAELACDGYSTCGHKWLLGPKGTGALFVREDRLDETLVSWAGSHSTTSMDYDGNYELIPAAARFEFGTRALADFAGLATAVSWMEDVGFARVEARIDELVEYAIEAVRAAGLGVSSPTAPEDRSGVFVLELPETCDSLQLYTALGDEGVLASPVRAERDFRLAIHFFNTTDEIDAAVAAIARRCGN